MGCSVFSGIFYPIEVMPSFLSNFSVLFPSTYSIDLIRERILEETSYSLLLNDFIFILFTSVLYYFVGLVTLKYSIYYAKIKGNLSHF
tara:strand:- start:659 stop:922 length:264 start_codon:yes stop_codon:yes gene_type:complete